MIPALIVLGLGFWDVFFLFNGNITFNNILLVPLFLVMYSRMGLRYDLGLGHAFGLSDRSRDLENG